jgi:two-component system LytT family response regulator
MISQKSPKSRIVFLAQDNDGDLCGAAERPSPDSEQTWAAMRSLSKHLIPAPLSVVPQKVSPTPTIRKPVREWIAGSKRVFIQDSKRCWIVRVADIVLLESEGNCTRVHFGRSRPVMARSLSYMDKRLDPAMFFRANRHTIINLRFLECIERWANGGFLVRLKSGQEIVVSRRQGRMLKEKMTL